jgi:poly(A) polymerase/tRNA nucleotidyltransferase (CCA-adding enzyme)
MAKKILERLKFPRAVIDKVALLVKNHMFYYNVDEVGEAGVRRVIRKVGLENINDLIDVRIADRLGSGVPKAVPYKLRHFKFMVDKVSHDALSVKQLKINGNDLIKELKIAPGPKIGAILDVLLAKVIDDQKLNNKKDLLNLSKDLNKSDLDSLRLMAKKKIDEERKEEEKLMKKKYWVE